MDCYPVINRNKLRIHATTWMSLKNLMLSEISQVKNIHTVCFHLYRILRQAILTDDERGQNISGLHGMRKTVTGSSHERPFWGDADDFYFDGGLSCTFECIFFRMQMLHVKCVAIIVSWYMNFTSKGKEP